MNTHAHVVRRYYSICIRRYPISMRLKNGDSCRISEEGFKTTIFSFDEVNWKNK